MVPLAARMRADPSRLGGLRPSPILRKRTWGTLGGAVLPLGAWLQELSSLSLKGVFAWRRVDRRGSKGPRRRICRSGSFPLPSCANERGTGSEGENPHSRP